MMKTTIIADAARKVRLEHGPDFYEMIVTGIAIGNVALVGIPGEPFSGIGIGIKKAEGWGMIMPCCCTNGSTGYFPMQDAYDEGGYEARTSNFKAGVAEQIIADSVKLLDDLR